MKIVAYMPLTWPTISSKVFKSFLEMVRTPIPGVEIDVMISGTFPLDRNRNEAVDLAMSSKYGADYIFFADADNIHPKDTISRLLSHCSDDFPVVSGLYWQKAPPHGCVQGHYSGWEKHEGIRKTIETMGFVDPSGNQCLFYKRLQDYSITQPIDVGGCGCLLVRTDVFKKIDLPYFAYFNAYSLGGDFSITHASEEMIFFCKLRKAGIRTLVVPSVRCGHETTKVIGCPEVDQ